MGRRADGREGARRRSTGWPDTHALAALSRTRSPTHDCTEAARLQAAGAVLVGLTTSPEFGSTNWTRTYLHGTTRNPWNPERTPGGSSGGSAAAVASGMMPICTGSDGGGSIRIPSSYSGLFGFKIELRPRRLRRRLRQRAHVGARSDVPVGARRGALRRRDRGPDEHRPHVVAAAGRVPTRTRSSRATRPRSCAGKRVAWSSTPRVRGLRSRGREALVRSRARVVRRRRASSSSTSTCSSRGRAGAWGLHLRRSRPRRHLRRRGARLARRRHAGVARRAARRSTDINAEQMIMRAAPPLRAARRDRCGVRPGRPVAHADDRDDRVRRRGPAAVRDRRAEGRRHGFGAVHRAVQHLGHARR